MEELQILSSVNPVGVYSVTSKRYKAEMLWDAVCGKISIQGEWAFNYYKCSLLTCVVSVLVRF